jgi:hypothetical protein
MNRPRRLATLTDQQVIAVFEALLGCPPRAADLAVLRLLNPSGLTVEDLAGYIHDHWLGSPDEPTIEQVEAAVHACLTEGKRQWRA